VCFSGLACFFFFFFIPARFYIAGRLLRLRHAEPQLEPAETPRRELSQEKSWRCPHLSIEVNRRQVETLASAAGSVESSGDPAERLEETIGGDNPTS